SVGCPCCGLLHRARNPDAYRPHSPFMKSRHAAAFALVGWYILIPPVFSPMGSNPRSSNDLTAPLNRWDVWGHPFDSEETCPTEKQHLRSEAPRRMQGSQSGRAGYSDSTRRWTKPARPWVP